MHGETQCKLLFWNACFWHNFITGVLQFTKQYGVMLTTSVFTNSLVPLYSRQGFWFWHLFRFSSFLPNIFASITLYSIRIAIILSQAEWASLRLCDLQQEIFIIWLDLMQGPSKTLGFIAFNVSKEGFYFSNDWRVWKPELWLQIIIFIVFDVKDWESFGKKLLSHL